jgi:hypothetical protein
LWRFELAGHPRDTAGWRGLYGYANSALGFSFHSLVLPARYERHKGERLQAGFIQWGNYNRSDEDGKG